jgi:ribonuclease HI
MEEYYRLYVDGSAIGNVNVDADTPAGWGVVCVKSKIGNNSHSSGKVQTELSGRVITDPESSQFIGAEVGSNNTGELSAIYHALKHIELGNHFNDKDITYVIFGDSMYAGNMAKGEWTPKENLELVKTTQNLWNKLKRAGINFTWNHIKAHSGHQWNERVDHLAFKAANEERPVPLNDWLRLK